MEVRRAMAGFVPPSPARLRALLRAVLLAALAAAPPAFADMFCGPGKHLGSENDGPGQSWLCVPDRPSAGVPAPAPASPGAARRLAPLPTLPSAPIRGGSGMAAAAGALGGIANLLSGIQNLQDALGDSGRAPQRDPNLVPGGMPAYAARAHDAIGIQYLSLGMALEGQSLVEAAAESYARAEQAAALAGDDELLSRVRERQAALNCTNALNYVMSFGFDPDERRQRYLRVQGVCKGSTLQEQLVFGVEEVLLGKPPPQPVRESLREKLRRALARVERPADDDGDGSAPAQRPVAAPAAQAQPAQAAPVDDDSGFWRARQQQQTRRQIWCDQQGAERAGCMARDNGGLDYCRKFFGDHARFDACQHAFHDPNIWYDATKEVFGMDPGQTRREIDRLLTGFDERVKGGDVRSLKDIQ